MKNLPKDTNIWYNCDKKNPTWQGGRAIYGTKSNPSKNMRMLESYTDILKHLKKGIEQKVFEKDPIAFIIGHVEDYRTTDGEIRQRLKVLGNMASKMNIEGKFEYTLMTHVTAQGQKKPEFRFRTQTDGNNSVRTPEGMFDTIYIPNDYQLIVDAINNY